MFVPKSVDLTHSVTFKRNSNILQEDIERQRDDKYNVLTRNCGFPDSLLKSVFVGLPLAMFGEAYYGVRALANGGFIGPEGAKVLACTGVTVALSTRIRDVVDSHQWALQVARCTIDNVKKFETPREAVESMKITHQVYLNIFQESSSRGPIIEAFMGTRIPEYKASPINESSLV